MVLYFLILLIAILGWVGVRITGEKMDCEGFYVLSMLAALFSTIIFLGLSIHMACKNIDAEDFEVRRDYCEELVQNISPSMSFGTITTTISGAKSFNYAIERNKKNSGNWFYGSLYNKKIGELELIEIPNHHFEIRLEGEE